MSKTNNVHKIKSETEINTITKKKLTPALIFKKAEPKTNNHKNLIDAITNNKKTISYGVAGSGKTFITLNLALQQLSEGFYDKIIVYRSTVGVRDDGFLPGTEKQKLQPFEEPYIEIIKETMNDKNCYHWLKDDLKLFDFRSTRFNQGITTHKTFMIVDECQNLEYEEIYNLATRLGKYSTIHFCGDYKKQNFLKKGQSGFEKFINIVNSDKNLKKQFEIVKMTPDDIMRDDFVRDFIIADFNYINH